MLPLFPLGVVLFPESSIQLSVFEQRYKNLVNDCLADGSVFGISPVLSDEIQDIGCTAKIVNKLKYSSDGKMNILVQGINKFTLKNTKLSPGDYLMADIDYIDESSEYPDIDLLEECVRLYNIIADEVKSLHLKKVNAAMFFSMTPSYFIVQKAGLTLYQKYHLLQLHSENERLKYLVEHLKKTEPMLKETNTIQRLIKNDGYAKNL